MATNLICRYLLSTPLEEAKTFNPLRELIVWTTDAALPVIRKLFVKSPSKTSTSFASTAFGTPASKRRLGDEMHASIGASEFKYIGVIKADFARGSTSTALATCIEMF